MDRDKAKEILKAFGNPAFKTKNNTLITFSRQDKQCVKDIEKKSDEELVGNWKSLVFMNYIYGQVGLNEIQRIALIELEFECRANIEPQQLQEWFNKKEEEFENQFN